MIQRIALLNVRNSYAPVPPLGILSLGSYLNKFGLEVKLLDIYPGTCGEHVPQLKSFQPQVIGISLMSCDLMQSRKIMEVLRPAFPDIPIIAGGAHPSAAAEHTFQFLGVEICFLGESELSLLEFCRRYPDPSWKQVQGLAFMEAGTVVSTGRGELIMDLDDIPYPRRELFDISRYFEPPGLIRGIYLKRPIGVQTSRGCPARCTYCSDPDRSRTTRFKSIPYVMEEIQYFMQEYHPIDGLYVMDEIFTIKRARVYEFCDSFVSRGFNIPWNAVTRANAVDTEMLTRMKMAGCVQIEFGVESGSPKVLDYYKKGVKVHQVKQSVALAKQLGLKTSTNFMIGAPVETPEDVEESIKLIKEIQPDFSHSYFLRALPGTSMYRELLQEGALSEEETLNYLANDEIGSNIPPFKRILTNEQMLHYRQVMAALNSKGYLPYLSNLRFVLEVGFGALRSPWLLTKLIWHSLRRKDLQMLVQGVKNLYRKSRAH